MNGLAVGTSTVVLSHRFWTSRFNGDVDVVGAPIRTPGGSATVVGVMPPEFEFPKYAELWTPMGPGEMDRRATRYWQTVGRPLARQLFVEGLLVSLLATVVHRRNREMAIRVAVGAGRAALIRQVVGEGLALAVAGIGLGLAGTFGSRARCRGCSSR